MQDIQELIAATASQTGEWISALRERVAKKLEDGRKSLAATNWYRTAEETKARTGSQLRENPWTGVAIAAVVGAALGWLLRRK